MLKIKEIAFSPSFDKEGVAKFYSEDAYFVSENLIALFDGATGLGNRKIIKSKYSDANWLVENAVKVLTGLDLNIELRDILKSLLEKMIEKYNKEKENLFNVSSYEFPSSTLLMVQETKDGVNILNLADGLVMWRKKGSGFGKVSPSEYLQKRGEELDTLLLEIVGMGKNLEEAKGIFTKEAMLVRGKKNQPDYYGALDLSLNCLNHRDLHIEKHTFEKGDKIMLTSDGLLRMAEIYGQMSYEELFEEAFLSLSDLVNRIRDLERKDINCEKFPRFKASDDVTAITIEVV